MKEDSGHTLVILLLIGILNMSDPRFEQIINLKHFGSNFNLQDRGVDRSKLNSSGNIELSIIKDLNGNILNNEFPLEATITSGPLFTHASEFPFGWIILNKTLPSSNTNASLECRSFNAENTNAPLNSFQSIGEGAFSSNQIILDDGASTSGWFSSDPTNLKIVGVDSDGIHINGIGSLGNFDFIYKTFDEVVLPAGTHDARYLAVDVISDRKGFFLELQAHHGLSFNTSEAYGFAPDPFRKIVQIDRINTKQTIFWDISDWIATQRNEDYIRALIIKVVDGSDDFNLHFKNWRLFEIDDFSASLTLPIPIILSGEKYFQYRITLSSNNANETPEVNDLLVRYRHQKTILPNNLLRSNQYFLNGQRQFIFRDKTKFLYQTTEERATAPPFNQFSTIFDGVDEQIDCGNDSSLDFDRLDPFSISLWLKTNSGSSTRILVSKSGSSSSSPGYEIQLKASNKFLCELVSGTSNLIQVQSNTTFTDGLWHHFVLTYDGSSTASGVTFYVDGSSIAVTINDDSLTGSILNIRSFKMAVIGTASRFYDGNLEEISVWNKELNSSEVSEIYNNGKPTDLFTHSASANVVSWWRMGDGDTFPTVSDNGPNMNDGAMINMEQEDFVKDVP